jgi:anti-sigma-K factor RskA
MSQMSRLLLQWLRGSPGPAARTVAPADLRRRVLASVYDEAERAEPRSCVPQIQPWTRLSPITIGLVVAVAVGLRGSTMPDLEVLAGEAVASVRIVSGVHGARASLSRFGSVAQLTVSGMPEPSIDETYELWLDREAGPPQPTDALFTPTRAGDATVDVPGGMRGVREMIVVSEPLGGSSSPTSPALLRVVLSRVL